MKDENLESLNQKGKNYQEIKELIYQAFEKVKSESLKNSKLGWCKYLADNLPKTHPSDKTLERYYKKYLEEDLNATGQPKEDIIDEICIWLGYVNFADFCHKNFLQNKFHDFSSKFEMINEDLSSPENKGTKKRIDRNLYLNKSLKALGVATILGLGTYFGMNLQKKEGCMYWAESRYQKISCEETLHPENKIVPFDEQKFNYFFKIEPTDTTTFFEAGVPKVYYIKVDGKPEFFSMDGKHPINGKELKAVSKYIIEKYVK